MAIDKLAPKAQPPQIQQAQHSREERNPQLMEAARLYESQFMREMLRAMRKTVQEGDLMQASQAEKLFRDQLDDINVDKWVENGGLGMADFIHDQIMEKFQNMKQLPPPSGPVPLDKSQLVEPIKIKDSDLTFKFRAPKEATTVSAPWAGQVLSAASLEHGLSSLLLDHDNGLKSSLVYKGSLLIPEGAEMQPGQRLGMLSSDNQAVFWKIHKG